MLLHGLDLDLTGWFQVAWSGDIGREQVVPLRYFGRDLVAYRGRDGVVRVHDRHCRHLGASLAHGGCVVDDGIQCPFHGWVWAPDGRNVSLPYQERPNRARRLGAWPVTERNESVYVWFDHAGRDPLWDVPDALHGTAQAAEREFHPAWPDGRQHLRDLRIHPQMVVENAVDPHHFRFVHHTAITPVILEELVEGPQWRARVGFGRGWRDHAVAAASFSAGWWRGLRAHGVTHALLVPSMIEMLLSEGALGAVPAANPDLRRLAHQAKNPGPATRPAAWGPYGEPVRADGRQPDHLPHARRPRPGRRCQPSCC
jgi:phenylpropionate dioxygenase-like ring-hydroxylating dioxygenase large terminal subunit